MSESIERSLGRMEGKLDALLLHMEQHSEQDDRRFAKIDSRLSVIEGWRGQVIGGAIATSAIVGVLLKWILK